MSGLCADSSGVYRLARIGAVQKINRFVDSFWFLALVGVLTVISNIFGADLIVYSIFIVFSLYIALFGTDFLPLMALVICCYLSPSVQNNPGMNESSIFFPQNGGIYLLCLFGLFLICALYRLITDKELGGKAFFTRGRKLLPGMLILGGAYLLGGAFSGRYFERGLLAPAFALLQFISVAGLYWFFAGAVHWRRVHKDYFAWLGLMVGLVVCCEVIGVYFVEEVVVDGAFNTVKIYTGWGNKNNMGAIIAMMIPFGLSLVPREKGGWIWNIATLAMLLVLGFTCSRTSIFFGIFIYFLTVGLMLINRTWRKKVLLNVGITSAGLLLMLIILFSNQIFGVIGKFWNWDFKSIDMRFGDYQKGLQSFTAHPMFGETFYPSQSIYEWSTVDSLKAVLPARWHNTVIQLLTSCGIVGMLAYCVHRFQTLRLFWTKRHTKVLFVGMSTLCLLLMSLLDCHFFNIGPTLFYSMGLAFAEKMEEHD